MLLEQVGVKLTPLQTLQYFGACATDISSGSATLSRKEFGYMLLCLASVQSQTFLLPQDLYFFVDVFNEKMTGGPYVFGTISVQSLYCLLNGIGIPVDQERTTALMKTVDKTESGVIT